MNINITLEELKQKAKEFGIRGYSKLNKSELFELLLQYDKKQNNIGENIEKAKAQEIDEETSEITEIDLSKQKKTDYSKEFTIDLDNNPDYKLLDGWEFDKQDKIYFEISTGKKVIIRSNGKRVVLEANTKISKGYLDIAPDGYGFLRDSSLRQSKNDVFVSETMIQRFKLAMGDYIIGVSRIDDPMKSPPLIFITDLNYADVDTALNRLKFENLTPIYPNKRINLLSENVHSNRLINLFSPIGYGQRGLIVSPPKAGKTTVLKNIGKSFDKISKEDDLMVLLVDERPEEVTEMKEIIDGHVISSTFDQKPQDHIHMAEFALEIAKRKVEAGRNVILLLDSITRLARAYNLTVPSSGKLLSGGFDPHALFKPKYFFGAARNTKEAGSLTIIATALVDTGSRLDDLIYEEFKGTGNMELHLDRSLAERRIYPAINIKRSGTRRDELLYPKKEKELVDELRIQLSGSSDVEFLTKVNQIIDKTETNDETLRLLESSKKI